MAGNGSGGTRFEVAADGLSWRFTISPDGRRVLALRGEIDLATEPQATLAFQEATDAHGGPLVVDLSGLDFMDCTGLHLLVRTREALRQQGSDLNIRLPCSGPIRLLFHHLAGETGLDGEILES